MVNVLPGTIHVELVDVDRGDVPHVGVSNGISEGGQPILIGLLAHSGRDQESTLVSPRSNERVPQRSRDVRVDGRRHGWGAIGLVETLNVLRVPIDVLEVPQSGSVLFTLLTVTPDGGDKDVRRVVGVPGGSIVPEPRDVRAKRGEGVGSGGTSFDTVGSETTGRGGSSAVIGRSGGRLSRGSGRRRCGALVISTSHQAVSMLTEGATQFCPPAAEVAMLVTAAAALDTAEEAATDEVAGEVELAD